MGSYSFFKVTEVYVSLRPSPNSSQSPDAEACDKLKATRHEFLPRAHSAAYGDLDKANWKNLRIRRNWNLIDPAIRPLIKILNENGFTTFSCCSGGHKRNLHRMYGDHEAGYVGFYPATDIAYKFYSELRNKHKRFDFDARTRTISRTGPHGRIETSEFGWLLGTSEPSRRAYYFELFEDMISIIEKQEKNRPIIISQS